MKNRSTVITNYKMGRSERKISACNKLVQASKEHDFGLKELEMSVLTQFWPVCTYD